MDEREARLEKLAALRDAGVDTYPARTSRDHTIAETLEDFDGLQGVTITLAGRLFRLREMGRAAFANIQDESGNIQIHFKRDTLGDEAYRSIKLLDLGDFIEVTGTLFTTKTNEKTLHVDSYRLLSKSLLP